MFKKILYPTDFSAASEKVIPYLLELKDAGAQEIVVLHVTDERYKDWKESLMFLPEADRDKLANDYAKNEVEKAKVNLEKVKKKLEGKFKIKTLIETGKPFKVIIDVANKEKVSCIAMASHGATDLQEMLLGSVTERVIRKSSQPCLVIKR